MKASLRWWFTASRPRIAGMLISSVASSWACATTPDSSSDPVAQGGSVSRSTGSVQNVGGMGTPAMGGSLVAIPVGASGGSAANATQAQCAADLRSIVDERGVVIKQCPSDQGCAGGECIPACEAAARSRGSIGCEFWALDPPYYANGRGTDFDGPCYAVFLANAWSLPARISVSRAGQSFDVTSFARIPRGAGQDVQYEPLPETGLPPSDVAVLFLSQKPLLETSTIGKECPVAPAILEDAAIQGSGRGSAFHIVSNAPLSAYDLVPYGSARSWLSSATLLLPASSWGTNYIALAPSSINPIANGPRLWGQLWATIVAGEDGTTVRVAPRVSLPGSASLASAPSGEVTEYTLGAGEAVQWISAMEAAPPDPSGTVIESNKAIGLFTGNAYFFVGSATSPMDAQGESVHGQIPPIRALGSEYVGPGIVTRLTSGEPESVPYRVLGVVSGTKLSWDPVPSPLAPMELDQGQVADFETTQFFSVRSQDADHPFLVTQYMSSAQQSSDCGLSLMCRLGGDDWSSLIATQQFLQRYVFLTHPWYPFTNLVVTRKRGPSGFADVDLDCLGTITGWRPVGNEGAFEVAHVDLSRAGVPVKSCNSVRHVAASDLPFGIVVWGTGSDSSYGYPAGGNFGPVNDVVIPPMIR